MQYAIAMVLNVMARDVDDQHKGRVHERVQYIPCLSREHACDMLEGLTRTQSLSYRDGPFITEVGYRMVYVIRDASNRRMYLDQSEVEMILSEYTMPRKPKSIE